MSFFIYDQEKELVGEEPLYPGFLRFPPYVYWEGGIYRLGIVKAQHGHYYAVPFYRFPDSPVEKQEDNETHVFENGKWRERYCEPFDAEY